MAKKVLTMIKLQIPGGQANPAPPVGPALGQHGVNIMEFCKAFNAQTAQENGRITPVEITVYEDRSFTFITKTPPAAVLIKEALGLEKGSAEPRPVQAGEWSGEEWIITSGVKEGDRVIVDGVMKLGPGAPVRIAQPKPEAKPEAKAEAKK